MRIDIILLLAGLTIIAASVMGTIWEQKIKTNHDQQRFEICIAAGGSWKDGNCRLWVPDKGDKLNIERD